jgi:S1-C subfamily serine protease
MRRLLALAALAVAGGGCITTVAAPAPDRAELVYRILTSTVQLRAERDGGVRRAASGVVVARDHASRRTWIVTARHFVEPPGRQAVSVRLPGRRSVVPATVAFVSRQHDLAIVETELLDATPVRVKETARLADEILIVAFPWGQRFTVTPGIVSQITSPEGTVPPDGMLLMEGPARMVSASVSYGSSGGGVFDAETGELVGIVEGYRTAKVAIPEMKERVLEMPVAGETTVIPTSAILLFLRASGLAEFLPK